jgi:hypothetical protein
MNVELDYAPPVPLLKRKWFRRCLAAAAVLAFVAAGYLVTHGWIAKQWHRYWLVQAQDQCMNYAADPQHILYSEEPGAIASLGHAKGYARISFSAGSPPTLSYDYVVSAADTWTKMVRVLGASGTRAAREHFSFITPMVYLHGLKTPSGDAFLACVERASRTETELSFWTHTHMAVTRKEKPDEFIYHSGVVNLTTAATPPATKPLRFYAGIADAADGMAFTMEYEVNGVKGHIRGKYTQIPPTGSGRGPNFPRLTMEIVDGPLKL